MVRQIRGSTQIMDDSVPPVKISDQGHGGTLDSDTVDGKHASELLAGPGGVGCLRADGSVPLTEDWDVGGHQIKWFLFQRADGSFPANPQEGMPCYRIDLQQAYVYTSSGWQLLNWNYIVPASQFVGYVDQSVGHYRAGGDLVFLDQVAGYKSLTELALGGDGGAPLDAEYVVTALHGGLTAEKLHSALAGADLHDPKSHTLASHSTKAHTELTDVTPDQHHTEDHAARHQDGGDDEVNVAGLSGQLVDDQPPLAHALGGAKHSGDLAYTQLDSLVGTGASKIAAGSHASQHQNGGDDEINVGGLSGVLVDEQDAGKIKGKTVDDAAIADDRILVYDLATQTLKYEDQAGGDGAPTDASYVTVDAEGGLSAEYVLGTAVIRRGPAANKPAASKAGLIYIETDGSYIVWRDNGTSWDEIARGVVGIIKHVHIYKEDKSGECDGTKTIFITAQQFDLATLRVFLNGQEQVDGAANDYQEGTMCDLFTMAVAPVVDDELIVHYLPVMV